MSDNFPTGVWFVRAAGYVRQQQGSTGIVDGITLKHMDRVLVMDDGLEINNIVVVQWNADTKTYEDSLVMPSTVLLVV